MKRPVALALALVALGGTAFAQLRLDAGVSMPVRVSVALDGSTLEIGSDVGGVIGLHLPDQTSRLPLNFYLGGKIAMVF